MANAITNFTSPPFACEILSLFIGKINLSFTSQSLGFQAKLVTKQLKIILVLYFSLFALLIPSSIYNVFVFLIYFYILKKN